MIDLHVHTTASDGAFSPREVVRLAVQHGLKAIAITDHDSVAGIPEAVDEARSSGLEIVPGIELSAICRSGTLHILGYFVRFDNPFFRRCLDDLRHRQQHLVKARLDRLRSLGLNEFPSTVSTAAEWALLDSGLFGNLGTPTGGKKAVLGSYGPIANLLLQDAVKLILAAGGIPVVAHPYSIIKNSSLNWSCVLEKLLSAGIEGVEAYHPTHGVSRTLLFLQTARDRKLLITGGSDFHVDANPGVQIGLVPGWSPLPYSLVEELRVRLKNRPERQ